MTNKEQQLFNFLQDNNAKELILTRSDGYKESYYKINFSRFDFVYFIGYIRNDYPTTNTKPEFAAVIDRNTGKLYFENYYLRRMFENWNGSGYTIAEEFKKILAKDTHEINEDFNNAILKAVDEIAATVEDDRQPDEDDRRRAEESAQGVYWRGEAAKREFTPGKKDSREVGELLKFIEAPADAVAETVADLKANKNLIDMIKNFKMMNRIEAEEIERINKAPEFAILRKAKAIKDATPEEAKSINLFYKLSNGETLAGKFDAEALKYMPYWSGEKMHFSSYNFDHTARQELKRVDGVANNDIYIKNIIKTTYKGRTLWQEDDNGGRA